MKKKLLNLLKILVLVIVNVVLFILDPTDLAYYLLGDVLHPIGIPLFMLFLALEVIIVVIIDRREKNNSKVKTRKDKKDRARETENSSVPSNQKSK